MRECNNSKIHISSNFLLSKKSYNNVGHLIICTIITLQHFTTLRYTSPHFTTLHFTTPIDTSLPLICTSLPSQLKWRKPWSTPKPCPNIRWPYCIKQNKSSVRINILWLNSKTLFLCSSFQIF